MCGFIRPPPSQVIQQRGDRTGKENEDSSQNRSKRPIEPGNIEHRGWLLFELAQHLRPEIALEFNSLRRSDSLLEKLFDFFVVFFVVHLAPASTLIELSCLRKMRTARYTRILTRPAEIPTASAILS